jgi:hypothetical protein
MNKKEVQGELQATLHCDEEKAERLAGAICEIESTGVVTPSLARRILEELGERSDEIVAVLTLVYDKFITPYVNVPGPNAIVHRLIKSGIVFISLAGYNALIRWLTKKADLDNK